MYLSSRFTRPELDNRVRTTKFKDYYDFVRTSSRNFEHFWEKTRPRRKVGAARLEELRELRLREWNGERWYELLLLFIYLLTSINIVCHLHMFRSLHSIYDPPKIALKEKILTPQEQLDPMMELENHLLIAQLIGLRYTHP